MSAEPRWGVARLWGVPQRAEYYPEVDTGVHLLMVLRLAAREAAVAQALAAADPDQRSI